MSLIVILLFVLLPVIRRKELNTYWYSTAVLIYRLIEHI